MGEDQNGGTGGAMSFPQKQQAPAAS